MLRSSRHAWAWLVAAGIGLGCNRTDPSGQTPATPRSQPSVQPKAVASTASEPLNKAEAVRHGGELYGRMCAVCHGAGGEGYKADMAPALAQPDFLASVSDDFLRRAIANGRSGSPMSAWANERGGPLSAAEIDALIAFMHSWEKRARVPLDERPAEGDAARGMETFARQCVSCHGIAGKLGPNVRIGRPELLAGASNGFLRHAIRNGRPGTTMAGFTLTLGDPSVEDVVAYLRKLQSGEPALPPPAVAPAPPLALGPVPLNPNGHNPRGFSVFPKTTSIDLVHAALLGHARMAILDARAPSDYLAEHIAGAVSVPFYDPTPYFKALPKNAWLVCYCSCPIAESGTLAQKLQTDGFTKVTVLAEGIGAWIGKKYPTHKGNKP